MKKYLFILITFFGIFNFSQTKEKELIIVQNLTLENFKIEELIKFVNSNFKSENEKAKFYYYWIAKNIKYDDNLFEKLNDSKYIPLESENQKDIFRIYIEKKAVCEGYSNLYHYLLNSSNIKNEFISGNAKTFYDFRNYEFNHTNKHAWNAVFINNHWILVDTTWASANSEITENYYDVKPERLILTHFPNDSKWQLMKNLITKDEFKNSPFLDNFYFEKGFRELPKINSDNKFIYIYIKKNPNKNWLVSFKFENENGVFERLICKLKENKDYKIYYTEKNNIPKKTIIRLDLTDFNEDKQTLLKYENIGLFHLKY